MLQNVLEGNSIVTSQNEKWVTDVTQFSVSGRKYSLSPILDLFNREIISYTLSEKSDFQQTINMVEMAFEKHPDTKGLTMHSDQGWQYQMKPYREILKSKGVTQSMSRKGNCLDNSVIENFFGIIKSEFFYNRIFKSLEEFINGIDEYIYYYNNIRLRKDWWIKPVQYRLKFANST